MRIACGSTVVDCMNAPPITRLIEATNARLTVVSPARSLLRMYDAAQPNSWDLVVFYYDK
ncbi:hypothetical protein BOTNAR_0122g00260 [Botryotinia narcissicola]|uniref:Uncharacterized protein n=1 Tax=Botryotinia narcissicola TaxID=278944 RepID=A0A4Z1IMV4_9HELO|nr:hypothetical protein BOTNAR_0122g00260 [Botryotinia narcissicola]